MGCKPIMEHYCRVVAALTLKLGVNLNLRQTGHGLVFTLSIIKNKNKKINQINQRKRRYFSPLPTARMPTDVNRQTDTHD